MSVSRIESILAAALPGFTPIRPAGGCRSWRYRLGPEGTRHARVEFEGGWVTIHATEPRLVTRHPLVRVATQGGWTGGAKYAAAGWGAAKVRVDIPFLYDSASNQDWLGRQIALASAGLRAAMGLADADAPPSADDGFDSAPESIAERCCAAGWQATVKPGGDVWVTHDSGLMTRTIVICPIESGLKASVSLSVGNACHDRDVLRACGHFLLRASATMRFARAWAKLEDSQISAMGFECALAASSDDAPLTCAIDAMSSACNLFGREAEALTASPSLARAYLEHAAGARVGVDARELQTDSAATNLPTVGVTADIAIA